MTQRPRLRGHTGLPSPSPPSEVGSWPNKTMDDVHGAEAMIAKVRKNEPLDAVGRGLLRLVTPGVEGRVGGVVLATDSFDTCVTRPPGVIK